MLGVNILLNRFSNNYWLHYFISVALYFGLLALLIIGPANKHTANDNTSGVVMLCELLESLTEEERKKIAFVFFDHEETGLLGSYLFKKQHKQMMQDKLLINFDCVSDGDNMLLGITTAAREQYGTAFEEAFLPEDGKSVLFERMEKIYYPSDHSGFPMALAAAALKHKPVLGYYMDRIHTSRDTNFDEANISMLVNGIHRFLEKL